MTSYQYLIVISILHHFRGIEPQRKLKTTPPEFEPPIKETPIEFCRQT